MGVAARGLKPYLGGQGDPNSLQLLVPSVLTHYGAPYLGVRLFEATRKHNARP